MNRGKPWTDAENELLLKMVADGFSPQAMFESGKFQERTVGAIRMQILRLGSNVATKHTAIVTTIKPAPDAISMEEVVKLFSTAFKQICEVQQVDKLTLERFRITFQTVKDYSTLLKTYEKWEEIGKRIEQLAPDVEMLTEIKKKEADWCQTPP